MVPDVHHLIAKRGGLFVNPQSEKSPGKLRLVYECAPLALIIEVGWHPPVLVVPSLPSINFGALQPGQARCWE